MSYQISPHLDRARRLIEAGDEHSLVYAALELRLGLEVVCYEKLRLRLEYVSPEDIRDWRPRQVLEALQELVEARIFEPAILERAEEPVGAEPKTWVQVGERKGMVSRRWSEIWNKLGRYLHAQEPAGRDTPVRAYPDAVILKKVLLDVIEELEPLASAGDINFPGPVTYFHCSCGMRVQRPDATLQPGQVITCFNRNCLREWVVEKDEAGQYGFRSNVVDIACLRCEHKTSVAKKNFKKILPDKPGSFTCAACRAKHSIIHVFQYALDDETSSP
jgi:hypothetical protein